MTITVAQPSVPRHPSHTYTGQRVSSDGGWLCEVCVAHFYSDAALKPCPSVTAAKAAPIWDAIRRTSLPPTAPTRP